MLRLHDIMTRDIVTLSPEHNLREAMSILSSRHISGAPVVANSRVVGVVSLTDLAEFVSSSPGVPTARPEQAEWGEWEPEDSVGLPEVDEPAAAYFQRLWDDAGAEVAERIAETSGPEWDALNEHVVGEAMTRRILSLDPGATVQYAARFMREAGIHRVLVMQEGELVGLVSTRDIADAVADNRVVNHTYVFGKPGER